jgi:hypothetical protein
MVYSYVGGVQTPYTFFFSAPVVSRYIWMDVSTSCPLVYSQNHSIESSILIAVYHWGFKNIGTGIIWLDHMASLDDIKCCCFQDSIFPFKRAPLRTRPTHLDSH